MKIKVFTLAIDDYFPELCELTLRTQRAFARQIGAEFEVLTERKLTKGKEDWLPVTYEKMQLWERFVTDDIDVAILLDADLILTPALANPIGFMKANSIGNWLDYGHSGVFKPGLKLREKAVVTNFLVVPKEHRDVFKPFEESELKGMVDLCHRPFNIDELLVAHRMTQLGLENCQVISDAKCLWHADVTSGQKGRNELLNRAHLYYTKNTDLQNIQRPDHIVPYLNFKGLTGQGVWIGDFKTEPLRQTMLQFWLGKKLYVINDWVSAQPLLDAASFIDVVAQSQGRAVSIIKDQPIAASSFFKNWSLDFILFERAVTKEELNAWTSKIKRGGFMAINSPLHAVVGHVPFNTVINRGGWCFWEV